MHKCRCVDILMNIDGLIIELMHWDYIIWKLHKMVMFKRDPHMHVPSVPTSNWEVGTDTRTPTTTESNVHPGFAVTSKVVCVPAEPQSLPNHFTRHNIAHSEPPPGPPPSIPLRSLDSLSLPSYLLHTLHFPRNTIPTHPRIPSQSPF